MNVTKTAMPTNADGHEKAHARKPNAGPVMMYDCGFWTTVIIIMAIIKTVFNGSGR
jgi:hypothetical protein